MKQREKLSMNDSLINMAVKMAEGNPGAVRVISKILEDQGGLFFLLDLDDMGMRGSQIWVAFKDYCGQDIEKLKQCLRDRDKKMVETVNRECPEHRAVIGERMLPALPRAVGEGDGIGQETDAARR